MTGLYQISPDHLARRIGLPDAPILLDVCIDEDFAADPRLIPGARRHPFAQVGELAGALGGQQVVIICQKGLKLSQGAAAILRAKGIQAEVLAGGNIAWRDAGLPLIPVNTLPDITKGGTIWVTRTRPKIDRIACPWLIRRFIDRDAQFLFVSPSEVEPVADRYGAIPFDIEGAFWSHRGDRCSFDTMVEEFGLQTAPLQRLAIVIRGADTNRHDIAAQAAGLLAVSVGFSRQFRDDNTQLEATLPLYDALYRWARDGVDEGHDWPMSRKA